MTRRRRTSDEVDPGWCHKRARRGRRLYCIYDKGHEGKHLFRRYQEEPDTRCTFLSNEGSHNPMLVRRCVKRAGHRPANAHLLHVLPWHQEVLSKLRWTPPVE